MSAPTRLFDRALIETRRRRARRIGPATFLLDRVAEDFADRLAAVLRRFERAVDLGTPTPAVRAALAGNSAIGSMIAVAPAFDAADPPHRCASSPTPKRCRSPPGASISSSRPSPCRRSTTYPAR